MEKFNRNKHTLRVLTTFRRGQLLKTEPGKDLTDDEIASLSDHDVEQLRYSRAVEMVDREPEPAADPGNTKSPPGSADASGKAK